ncbi:hypothetical protein [Cochlodiniinecator piscidefendens]|nr:hypothetical protein [Cochlodiniinecator piscidefendens]
MNKPFKLMMEETWAGALCDPFSQSGIKFQEISNGMSLHWPSKRQL